MNLIVPEDEKRRMNYVKLIGKGEVGYRGDFKKSSFPEKASLEEWCRVYCEDSAGIKQFVLPHYPLSFCVFEKGIKANERIGSHWKE